MHQQRGPRASHMKAVQQGPSSSAAASCGRHRRCHSTARRQHAPPRCWSPSAQAVACSTQVPDAAAAQPSSAPPQQSAVHVTGRRAALAAACGCWVLAAAAAVPGRGAAAVLDMELVEAAAYEAYARREFGRAVQLLTQLMDTDPRNPRWAEMRAEVLVDGKNFRAALDDFNAALAATPASELTTRARLVSGRALAYEGLADWAAALSDYDAALQLAADGGESPDPYVINSRGNCNSSLGNWSEAREDYQAAMEVFQRAKGFRGRGGTTTQRLDGAIYAASNAALMLAQMGDEEGALKEITRIARRAPGSVDMRAALAAMYWGLGREEEAEGNWEYACDNIVEGCRKYQDRDWLRRIRRWPPVMVDKLQNFLALRSRSAQLAAATSAVTAAAPGVVG